jgi:peptide/nickel transport system permease protein
VSVALQEPGLVEAPRPARRRAVWQVVRRRPSAAIGLTVLVTIILVALLAPLIAPYGLHDEVGPVFGHPSWSHPLGLDDGGVDMVTLLMWGARISLVVGFAATLVSMLVGGAVACWRATSAAGSTSS